MTDRLPKVPTGIDGFDEITRGGLPAGRTTLVCGGPGCGKTLFAMEFAVRACRDRGEPAVFVTFEEPPEQLTANVASLGFDVPSLVDAGLMVIDHVRIDHRELAESGDYDLEGLFIRLDYAIGSVNAKVVVMDTIEALFAILTNTALLRSELRRLFRWLAARGMTSVITAEGGDGRLTRHGLEEYVSDCVIALDHRVHDEISTRRLRIVKYRGSSHGQNEYPFLVDDLGFSVLPATSMRLDHAASSQRISTGVPELDEMLGGEGLWQGSSMLLSGRAGTGKTTLASRIAVAACERGERASLLLFEESPAEVVRNMRSVGFDLQHAIDGGLMRIHAERPHAVGLEAHLLTVRRLLDAQPDVVVVDAITSLNGEQYEIETAIRRLVDMIKRSGAPAVLTSLTSSELGPATSGADVSSAIDAWLMLDNPAYEGERNRVMQVLKARGIAHSNQVREFRLGGGGIEILTPYAGTGRVLMGTARIQRESMEHLSREANEREISRRRAALARRRAEVEAQTAALRADIEAEAAAVEIAIREQELGFEASVEAARMTSRARVRGSGPP